MKEKTDSPGVHNSLLLYFTEDAKSFLFTISPVVPDSTRFVVVVVVVVAEERRKGSVVSQL